MTLGDFISRMEQGWGFARPGTVRSLGTGLRHAFEGADLDQMVEVEYRKTVTGSGHEGRIDYTWTVKGATPAQSGTLPPTPVDIVFGRGLPPYCRLINGGFIVGY